MKLKKHSPGDTVNKRYKIVSYINEGGMQEVYLAKDIHLRRNVALKTPKTESAAKRFSRSAILSARINHPNVAKTLDFFEFNDKQYLIEEYIKGSDLLQTIINPLVNVDPYLAAKIIHHLSKGVFVSHQAKVIHRDLKPSNVMISGGLNLDAIKITDFGISKMAQDEIEEAVRGGESSITGSLTMVGALPYMSPEMIETPHDAGKETDIWSIGAMLFELVSGDKPFGVGLKAVPRILSGILPPKPPHLDNGIQFKQLGSEIYDIICMCLNKDPAKRPSSKKLVKICSNMCYQVAERKIGVVTSIQHRAWGFISNIEDQSESFFHLENVFGILPSEGDLVCYSEYHGSPKPRAYPVVVMRQK